MHISATEPAQPGVSIVIPVYNEEQQLEACLKTITAQTVQPLEVIVVDNNCSDRSMQIAAQYPFVTIIKESELGIVFARDAGFNAAQGEILARIDADTRLMPNWMETLIDYMSAHPDVAAVTGKCYHREVPLPRLISMWHASVYHGVQCIIAGGEILWGTNMAIRREAWQKVKNECRKANDVDEDIDLSIKLHRHNLSIKRVRSLKATASLLHGDVSPKRIVNYLASWPRNYSLNGMPVRALLIKLVMYTGLCIVIPPSLVIPIKKVE